MKRSAVAVCGIIVVGTLWVGATWYTGKVAEEQYQTQIERANQKLAQVFKNSKDSVKVELAKFERGVFSSDVNLSIVINSAQQNETLTIPFAAEFYHGPLPLNRVARLNFMPVMFSANLALAKNEQTKVWFGKRNKSPISSYFSMGYDKRMKGESDIDVDTEIDGGQIIGKMVGEFDVDMEGYGWGEAKSEKWTFILPKKEQRANPNSLTEGTIEANDITVKYHLSTPPKDYPHLLLGEYRVQMGDMKVVGKKQLGDFHMDLKDVQMGLSSTLIEQFVNFAVTYNIGGLNFSDQGMPAPFSLGKVGWHMEFNHLEPKSVNTILAEFGKIEPNMPAQKMSPAVNEAMRTILKHQPQFKFDPVSLVNNGGKMEVKLNMALANDNFDALAQGKVLELYKEFGLHLAVDKAAVIELVSSFLTGQQQMMQGEAKKLAETQLENFLQQIRPQNIFVEDDKSVKLDLELKGDKLDFNGRLLSNEELTSFILGAMMMSQGK